MELSLRPQCQGLRAPRLPVRRTRRTVHVPLKTQRTVLRSPKLRCTNVLRPRALVPKCQGRSFDPLKIKKSLNQEPVVTAEAVSEHVPIPQGMTSKFPQGLNRLKEMFENLAAKLASSSGEWKSFLPMTALFFFMAFVNTIVSNLSMSLVITAQGGGAGVIPYLTAYVAFPMTLAATVLYTYASHFISRRKLFTITIGLFAAFNMVFALCLYPNHELLHLPGIADTLSRILPSGFDGAVGMVRNWTFSLFYCLSEMWGDMGITLLFWGFANDVTTSEQAPIFYPLMGIGANVAQTLGGIVLKMFSAGDAASVGARYQGLIFQVVGCMMVVLALHRFITNKTNVKKTDKAGKVHENSSKTTLKNKLGKETRKTQVEHKRRGLATMPQLRQNTVGVGLSGFVPIQKKISASSSTSRITSANGKSLTACFREPSKLNLGHLPLITAHELTNKNESKETKSQPVQKEKKKAPSFGESISTLRHNPVVLSLGWMTIAQALSITLMEFVWKSHLKLAYPTAAAFSAFMGDIAASVGILTGAFMFLSPILFKKIGWTGVARITPLLMTIGGGAFFVACSAFHIFSHLGMTQLAQTLLPLTVIGGSFLFVLSRGTKFSLFKPSEEMVYINMDEKERMKGKAAVDVVGANMGKSGGSILQQALLLASGGHLLFITPIMFGVYMFMMRGWNNAVTKLSSFQENEVNEKKDEQEEEEEEKQEESELSSLLSVEVQTENEETGSVGSVVEFVHHHESNDDLSKELQSHPVPV
eukprot:g4408.t1